MRKIRSRNQAPEDAAIRQPLQELRDALLDLHKTLIDSERAVYETNVGPINSPHHFLQLLSGDPWFAWLRPVSQLIVAMDEALDAKEPLTRDGVDVLMTSPYFCWSRPKEEVNSAIAIWLLCSEIPTWFLLTRKWPNESVQGGSKHDDL
jgi:hypothetical protein